MKHDLNKFFYIAVKENKDFIVYESEPFRLSELDFLSLIKILYVNKRHISMGEKLIRIYRDSTKDKSYVTEELLKSMGIKDETRKEHTNKTK